MRRRQFIGGLGSVALIGATEAASARSSSQQERRSGRGDIENVILMIGDGMGFDPVEVTSVVHGDLELQSMTRAGLTRTNSRSGEVTDSAAAGTALATGLKAYNGQVSVRGDRDPDDVTPLTTQLELAAALGMNTGLVSTTRITHATPAVFGAHVPDRDSEGTIADHLVETGPDVLLGGGRQEWSDDHLDRAREAGYEVLSNAADLESAGDGPLLGLFDESHVTYTLDRDDSIPSLPAMTRTALDRLDGDDGFFLMVEGGRIDHAEHGNDAQTTVAETLEFDEAVSRARDFVADRDDTLLVVTSDHETGGMATGSDYGSPIDGEAIRNASASNAAIAAEIESGTSVRDAVTGHVDVDLSEEDVARIEEAREADGPYALSNALGEVLSRRLGVSWASNAHTGPAQVVLADGPTVEPFDGWVHHVDLSATLTALLLFGGVPEVPGRTIDAWERSVTERAPGGPVDAQFALRYLGPADDDVSEALDLNGDGVVDYGDVLEIYDPSVDRGSLAAPVADPASIDGLHADGYHDL